MRHIWVIRELEAVAHHIVHHLYSQDHPRWSIRTMVLSDLSTSRALHLRFSRVQAILNSPTLSTLIPGLLYVALSQAHQVLDMVPCHNHQ
jgi:hypothetical protein